MLKNRRYCNYKKINKPFRSHIDVNNYNNLLLELDKKELDKKELDKKELYKTTSNSDINHNKFIPTNCRPCPESETVQSIINNIEKKYESAEFKDPYFTGASAWETLLKAVEKISDPNLYTPRADPINKIETNVIKRKVDIVAEINNIGDLLTLIDTYALDPEVEYNINMKALHNIKSPLTELNNMIGMANLKENILDQILFYIQNLQSTKDTNANDFMHTVIYGPPGTGKTEIAKIMGSIFSKLGILNKGTFKKVTRADLIAGYLGQTALKTRDVIRECLGGVLFIDEAYALGNDEKRDSFSKECIDTLCEALSDHKNELMVIIAGYEKDLNECFFNYNQGLNSRFTWRFKTDEYSAQDLHHIFVKKIQEAHWSLSENAKIDVKWFEKHKAHFKCFGRDMETLFAKTKIAHSRRVFCLPNDVKKQLTIDDLDSGMNMYLKNEDSSKKEKERFNKIISSMYV